jgi:hypothetical protein
MLQTVNPKTSTNKEQLLAALVASLKMLLISLALIVVVTLFVKSLLSFAVVVLTAGNLFASWIIDLVVTAPDMREFCHFLATR